jgi:hypothetical protein
MKDANSKSIAFGRFSKWEVKPISMMTGQLTDPECPDAIHIPLNEDMNLETASECVEPLADPLVLSFHEHQRANPLIGK